MLFLENKYIEKILLLNSSNKIIIDNKYIIYLFLWFKFL